MNLPSTSQLIPPSRLSQSTRLELSASYSKFLLAIYFTYGNVYVSMVFSHQFLFVPPISILWATQSVFCYGSLSRPWCEELTHWKRPWCWEGLGEGGEGDNRGWDGWMASLTPWTWVWVNSGSWWWIGRPGVLGFMGSQRVRHGWATELNWTWCGTES